MVAKQGKVTVLQVEVSRNNIAIRLAKYYFLELGQQHYVVIAFQFAGSANKPNRGIFNERQTTSMLTFISLTSSLAICTRSEPPFFKGQPSLS